MTLSSFWGPLYTVRISVPPPGEQQSISALLSAWDDEIELNRQMNQTLEAMAQALFKSWFVDFDPVRAKAEGRRPDGIDDGTAALFPDRFEESAISDIPNRWSTVPLSTQVDVV